ncbi:MAG: hypothetical protein Q9162_003528, partial [Coniocarpon cinnabarinum]
MEKVKEIQKNQAYSDILQSLTFDEIAARESQIPEAHKDTFRWALKPQPVEEGHAVTPASWFSSADDIYW